MSAEDIRIETLLRAFRDDDFAQWLLPERRHRHHVYREWFRMVLAQCDQVGLVITAAEGKAVQVWFRGDEQTPEMLDEAGSERLVELAGPAAVRFREFGVLSADRHPRDPHRYLALIAVDPALQGTGIGTRTLRETLARWDADGLPSYLEASSADSRRLYARLGFTDIATPIVLPAGPTIYPMWRAVGG